VAYLLSTFQYIYFILEEGFPMISISRQNWSGNTNKPYLVLWGEPDLQAPEHLCVLFERETWKMIGSLSHWKIHRLQWRLLSALGSYSLLACKLIIRKIRQNWFIMSSDLYKKRIFYVLDVVNVAQYISEKSVKNCIAVTDRGGPYLYFLWGTNIIYIK
jgi:hypothetical protein